MLEPAEKASLTRSLRMIPTHTCPSCDQTAEPSGLLGRFHFTSSAISGSASRTILRSFASIAPRQSGVFAINSSTGPARVMSAPHSFVYWESQANDLAIETQALIEALDHETDVAAIHRDRFRLTVRAPLAARDLVPT